MLHAAVNHLLDLRGIPREGAKVVFSCRVRKLAPVRILALADLCQLPRAPSAGSERGLKQSVQLERL